VRRDAERDPIVQAGALRCRECGCVAFPADAARLDETLIIADYPAPCVHASGGTLVIGVADLPAAPPEPSLALYVRGRRCAGLNREGRPCGSYARPGSDYCLHHPAVSTAGNPA
jgi:hypothetical protein